METTSDEAERRASIQRRDIPPTHRVAPTSTLLYPDPWQIPGLIGTNAIRRPVARCADCEESRGNRDSLLDIGVDHPSIVEGHLKALAQELEGILDSEHLPAVGTGTPSAIEECRNLPRLNDLDIVVAHIGQKGTLKRYQRIDSNTVELQPVSSNAEHRPMPMGPTTVDTRRPSG